MRVCTSTQRSVAGGLSTRRCGPVVVATLMVAACGHPAPIDTVDSLIAHPDRLRDVERACRVDYMKIGAVECSAAAEAQRRLFMGNGKAQYTPPKELLAL